MTLQEAIDRTQLEGSFDEPDSQVQVWVLDRLRQMVAEALWRVSTVTIGTTVADQATYALDGDVVDLRLLYVGTDRYDRISPEDLLEVKGGRARRRGTGGLFAPYFDADANEFVEIYPVPTTSGDTINGLTAMEIPSSFSVTDELPIPGDLHRYVIYGAVAEGLAMVDERIDSAQPFEQMFKEGISLLTKRRHSRQGSGPRQIRVAGYHVRY